MKTQTVYLITGLYILIALGMYIEQSAKPLWGLLALFIIFSIVKKIGDE